MSDLVHRLMISSTWLDLKDERFVVRDACLGSDLYPDMMEYDPAKPDQGIMESSYEKVDRAHAYLVLISDWRYGQILKVPDNPDGLSVTELEFRRAEKRGIPIIVFLRADDAPLNGTRQQVQAEAVNNTKLDAFRAHARHHSRITDTFTDATDLNAKVVAALNRLRPLLTTIKPIERPETDPAPNTIPAPPAFHAQPPYIPSHQFQGRKRELDLIRSWATSPHDPVLVFEAIGGMGKSMVTWEWTTKHAPADRPDWAGRLWYSFYERGADMTDFCVTALSYITEKDPDTFKPKPTWDLAHQLLSLLRGKPYLLVLDGLERVLVAYHRSDAAQVRDEEVEAAEASAGRAPRACIRPDDGDLLKQVVAAGPSKVLITTRLLPVELTNPSGPLPGVRHVMLTGLDQPDAAAMLIQAGIKGDAEAMGRFLDQQFGCHPLVVGIVAGVVKNWLTAPGNFDRWVAAPDGGSAANLTDPDIAKRRAHLLRVAFNGLDPQARELIARIAMIANAVPLDVLEALNPARPPPPPEEVEDPEALDVEDGWWTRLLRWRPGAAGNAKARIDPEHQARVRGTSSTQGREVSHQSRTAYQAALATWGQSLREAERRLLDTLADLRARGLLQWDHASNLFDLHPVVRGYAVGMLDGDARARSGQHVADLFAARPQPAYQDATGLADLANPIQTVRALNLAGKVKEAWDVLNGDLRVALHRLELHHDWLALMQPLFPDGWSAPSLGVEEAGIAAAEVVAALHRVGFRQEAAIQSAFAIQAIISSNLSEILSLLLRNHSNILSEADDLPGRERLLAIARAVGAGDTTERVWCDVFQASDLIERGRLTEARALWSRLAPDLPGAMRQNQQFESQARHTETWLLFREGALTPDHLRATLDRLHALGERAYERWTLALAGEWHQANNRHTQAIESFTQAITMAHEVNLRDTTSEARRGLSLARFGRIQEARDAAASAERAPPHWTLASLYLALNQPDQARDHALKGYELAWANGPPYVRHWPLEECRAVLRALNVPEPQLPPFDLAKHQPFPWEADIHRMLEEHAAKQRKEDS